MKQGKLDVVKKKMARVNVILVISELKWTGMSKFNSGDHCIYYCGQEFFIIAPIVNKRLSAVLGCNLKERCNDLDLFPRQTIQHHGNPSLCPNH